MNEHIVEDFVTGLQSATTVDGARDLFSKTLAALDVGHYTYLGLRFRGSGLRARPFFITTYPQPWVEHYDSSNYLRIDPVMLEAPTRNTPMSWGTRDQRRTVTPRQRAFLDEAADMGLRQGTAIPIHGPGGEFGLVSVTVDGPPRQFANLMRGHLHQLQLLSLYYHTHAAEHFIAANSATAALTRRERECLQWSAQGKSSWEISETLAISEATVSFHLRNAMGKLGVHSRPHAIAKAVMAGIITP
ncbi:MAG: LuxR family transcriptional regulator [Bacteroidales bacterium]